MSTRTRRRASATEDEAPPPLPAGAPFLMNRRQVAQALGVSQKLLNQLIALNKFPGPSTTEVGHPKWHPAIVAEAIDRICGRGG